MARDILIVDDEADIRDLMSGILSDEGFEARTAASSDTAMAAIERRLPSLVILDIWLQGSRLDGLELLDLIKSHHPTLPVIMISGHGNIETAVAAIKLVEKLGGVVMAASFVIDLPELGGRALVEQRGVPTVALIAFDGH
jgi:DNA-binding NtrC family response regulator